MDKTGRKFGRQNFTLRMRGYTLELGAQTRIMGIINVTPDSFSKDGLLNSSSGEADVYTKKDYDNAVCSAIRTAKKFIKDGADILDVGGQSTRPGSERLSTDEEMKRVIPVVAALKSVGNIPISVDTYKNEVAREALLNGACMVNNIMGTKLDKALLKTIKKYEAGIVVSHIKGTPKTMQRGVYYDDVVKEIINALNRSVLQCTDFGIAKDKIIIDPGIGFGKRLEDNLTILNNLDKFRSLKYPLLVGTSRKSFIGNILGNDVSDRLIGTLASISFCVVKGVHIVRVHDVKETKETIKITEAIINQNGGK